MNSLFALTIIFVIYAIGDIVSTKTHAIVSILVGKIFHESWYLCCAMNITALFGFPGTVIVPTEVTKAVAETENEKKLIQGSIMPKMIISGMVSVSVVSVVVAGIMSAWSASSSLKGESTPPSVR